MTSFHVWAPHSRELSVVIGNEAVHLAHPMRSGPGGWWSVDVPEAGHGTDYAFVVDGGDPTPDPRSLWQPNGVNAASRVYEHDRYAWSDRHWRGVSLPGAVLYELHVGTFTPEGTFDAAIKHLDHLEALGIDAVELLPCNGYAGHHGWGYDGVDLYTVHEPYGGPDGLKRFIDACHQRGIGVVMDVVYNHLGPAGNYLARFGPYFTDTHATPWGTAVNLDDAYSDEVRRFLVDNALMWLRDFRCDGLRLDAIHELRDDRAIHILEELAVEVEALASMERRPLFLIAESDLNDPKVIRPRIAGGYGIDAQWCDDVHHALWATLSGERQGYYDDFGPLPVLAKALNQGFVHDGGWSSFRKRSHGRRPVGAKAPQFVVYLQDHDQIGNRAMGDRAAATLSDGLLCAGAALLLLSPFTPMLFMGEEWGARTPWQFFSDHAAELGRAVSAGRRREFADHGWSTEEIPDPQDPATFAASKLDWNELRASRGRRLLQWYQQLIALRRAEPALTDQHLGQARFRYDELDGWFIAWRGHPDSESIGVAVNLAERPQDVPVSGELLLSSSPVEAVEGGYCMPGESVAVVRAG
ncbi:MAG TPA: malto-oligosyltrehalose trehalohydrolase [Frankiaceae bacterium]|nr:malto-oligosyltrehalose trehalohydrolase [Frankiaceae bacterium]